MVANELAEVRKLINLLSQTEIAIERIILRLETIKELSIVMVDLKPALSSLKNLTTSLVDLMPDIASELDKVNSSIQDTLSVTKVSSEQPIIQTDLKTPGGQEIIREVNAVLEQRLAEQLPEPPVPNALVSSELPKQKIREMVALVAGCPDSCGDEDEEENIEKSAPVLSIKDVEMQSISLRIENAQSLEDRLLKYIKQRNGQIDVTECALRFKIPPKEVEKTLETLSSKGRIIMGE